MKIRYENDEQRGPGHGLLHCTGETFPEGEYSLILERASEPRFLGNQGWTDQRSPLEVEAVRNADSSLTLLVGPRIVDLLDSLATYRATVQAAGADHFTAGLGFRNIDIRYSPAGQTGNVPGQAPEPKPEPQPEPEPVPPPEPEPEPEPVPEPKTAPEPPPVLPTQPSSPQPPKKSRALLFGAILFLLLAAAGGAAWYFLKMKKPDEPVTPPETPRQSQTQGTPEQPRPPAPPPEQPPGPPEQPGQAGPPPEQPLASPTAQGTVERVNAFFADTAGRTPAAAARLSREVRKETPQDQDAAYRLLYFAAEQGEASAYMDYGACLDPAKPQWGSITKDARAAWTIYEKAKATQPEAAQAQHNMRSWLEQQAAAGNRDATRWLRDLPPAQP